MELFNRLTEIPDGLPMNGVWHGYIICELSATLLLWAQIL